MWLPRLHVVKMPGVHMRDAQCTYTMAPPNFSRLDNPISTKQQGGTDYAQLIITGTPGFSDLLTALSCILSLPGRALLRLLSSFRHLKYKKTYMTTVYFGEG